MPKEGGFAGHPKKRIRVFWGPRSRPYKNHQRSAALRPGFGVRLAHMRLPCARARQLAWRTQVAVADLGIVMGVDACE